MMAMTLSNYDIIGDAKSGTGLFALQGADTFNFLCVPPLTRETDVGSAGAAGGVAPVPPASGDADASIRPRPGPIRPRCSKDCATGRFYSEDALMFYPRVRAFDRLRGRQEVFGSAPAVAGMLARLDRTCPIWSAADTEEAQMRPALRPAIPVWLPERASLLHAGVNLLQPARTPRVRRNQSAHPHTGGRRQE